MHLPKSSVFYCMLTLYENHYGRLFKESKGPFKNYVTAMGEGGGSRSVTAQPNGTERPLTRCNGGEGVILSKKKRYVIFERFPSPRSRLVIGAQDGCSGDDRSRNDGG